MDTDERQAKEWREAQSSPERSDVFRKEEDAALACGGWGKALLEGARLTGEWV